MSSFRKTEKLILLVVLNRSKMAEKFYSRWLKWCKKSMTHKHFQVGKLEDEQAINILYAKLNLNRPEGIWKVEETK